MTALPVYSWRSAPDGLATEADPASAPESGHIRRPGKQTRLGPAVPHGL
ncbi:hypothetical protein ACFT8W_40610 [Streptomyces hygroscopicus]